MLRSSAAKAVETRSTTGGEKPTVLFHTYHFPPIGGSGAQRPLKMVRYLAELGYRLIVVTGGGATADRWAPADETLMAEIPESVQVKRLDRAGEPPPSRWDQFAERWLGATGRWNKWWCSQSYRAGVEAGVAVDLIYVWMQPYASARAGAALSKALRRPWIADLGDPWALDEMIVHPSALHRRLELRRMGALLSTASAIVMSTPEAADRLRRAFPALASRAIVSIPNGFDSADFGGEPKRRKDAKFRIVHTGYLHTELGERQRRHRRLHQILRGGVPGLDILTRSHVYLVAAINLLLARRPDLSNVLELHLAGVVNESDRRVASACPVVTLHGYTSHADSIALMRTADLLFLPMHNLPATIRATIVPGKTYEYLASGTPILAAVPDGDAREILREAGNAHIVRPDDVTAMAEAIAAEVDRARTGAPPRRPNTKVVDRFEYRRLADELGRIFDVVAGSRRAR